jgi:hypothetical protein
LELLVRAAVPADHDVNLTITLPVFAPVSSRFIAGITFSRP